MEKRQSCLEAKLESKLDRMMEVIRGSIANELGHVNKSFTEGDNSIPLGIVLDDGKGAAKQVPDCTVKNHLSNEKRDGKFFIL